MKKWILFPGLILIALFIYVYLYVPAIVELGSTSTVNCSSTAVLRMLAEPGNRVNWWPGNIKNDSTYQLNEYTFKVKNFPYKGLELVINDNKFTLANSLIITQGNKDSSILQWSGYTQTGLNPFKRLSHYKEAKRYKEQTKIIIQSFKRFVEDKTKLYGIEMHEERVADSFLVSTSGTFNHQPTTQDVYGLINQLRVYIATQGAKETNYPMLFTQQQVDNKYLTKVAIPVDKALQGTGQIVHKRMIPGTLLVTGNIQGGESTIIKVFDMMENYLNDHQITPPAIPFELLVTDRTLEPDTSKWITRIYYPIY